MIVLLHRERLKAALVDVSGSGRVVVSVPTRRVRQRQPAHEPGQVAVGTRIKNQVPMVGHDAIGEQTHAIAFNGLLQHAFERLVIRILVEQRCSAIGPVEGVVDVTAVRMR